MEERREYGAKPSGWNGPVGDKEGGAGIIVLRCQPLCLELLATRGIHLSLVSEANCPNPALLEERMVVPLRDGSHSLSPNPHLLTVPYCPCCICIKLTGC